MFAACEGNKPEPPEARRAAVEKSAADEDGGDKRAEVRTAAREFVSRTFPDWKIGGIAAERYTENDYTVTADISKGDERQSVAVDVRLYVDDSEHTYWKAEHWPKQGEQKVGGYVIRPYQQ
jgi:hypothetical protein